MTSSNEILQRPVTELKDVLATIPTDQLKELHALETKGKNRMVALQFISLEIKRREILGDEKAIPHLQEEVVAKPKRYSVIIPSTDKDSSDVPLSVNGSAILIQRDKKVIVNEEYVECLRHAVVNTIARNPDTGKTSSVSRPRYSYFAEQVT